MTPGLDQFAERLGIAVHVLEQLVAGRLPAREPAVERPDTEIAQRRELFGGPFDQSFAIVVEHDRHVLARQPDLRFHADAIEVEIGSEQRMPGREGRLVAQIKHRDFLAEKERPADAPRGNRTAHAIPTSRLGTGASA